MAGEKVLSGNLRLTLDGKTIFDATDCSLSLSRETKQRAATKDTATGVSTKGQKTWTASYNGLATHAGDGTASNNFYDLFDIWNDDTDTPVVVQFVPQTGDAATHLFSGLGIVVDLSGNWNVDEDGTCSLSINSAGDMEKVLVT